MAWKPEQPYNDLPRLPPVCDLETKTVLKQCVKSRTALAELKQAAKLIPNQTILINTLPLLEAKDSSEIENIITTTDKLFRYVQSNRGSNRNLDAATKEALRYRTALLEAFQALKKRPLNTKTVEQICSRIKNKDMTVRKIPGTALASDKTGDIIYTPPVGEKKLRDYLSNWENYLHNESDIDPLIRMAVVHYQFEAIHPFTDGNGRTGRIINSLYLIQEELLSLPILYLSQYITKNKTDYYHLLLNVTRSHDWEPWIMYMLRAIEYTAEWTTNKISAIRELTIHTTDYIRQAQSKIYTRELVDVIFEQPYCRISSLVDASIAKRQTASEYLKRLEGIGVLKVEQIGREKLFIHPKFLQLLSTDTNKFKKYPMIKIQ